MPAPADSHFADRLQSIVLQRGNPVMVGLDPRLDQLPSELAPRQQNDPRDVAEAYRLFCRGVIDVVAELVPTVKPQAAFFEELGPAGGTALADVIQYAQSRGLLVILDGKRNDIASTATAYASGYLGRDRAWGWGADALTVSPYLGDDSLEPFVDVAMERGCGIFVLVKTSNPGGGRFQDLICDQKPMFQHVAEFVEGLAQKTADGRRHGAVGAVVGATYPRQLSELRSIMPHAWILVPGYGSQGGSAADAAGAFHEDGTGALINNARGIIYAWRRPEYSAHADANWQRAVESATRDMIEQLRSATAAGGLPSPTTK